MKKSIAKMNRDEIRAEISLLVMAHPEAPRALGIYSDFFVAPTSTRAGRKNNFAIWTRGSAPELVAELRALCDRLDELDASSRAAAALGRKGGKAKSAAKAAARANGAKGGRPAVGGLLQYIPARLRAHVEDAYRDSDGIWMHFDESVCNRANESGTIHADSIRELREEARECAIVRAKS